MVLLNSSPRISLGPLKPSVALLICLARVKLLSRHITLPPSTLQTHLPARFAPVWVCIACHPSLGCPFLSPPAIVLVKCCRSFKVFKLLGVQVSPRVLIPSYPKNLGISDTSNGHCTSDLQPRLHIRITQGLEERWGSTQEMSGQ